MALQSSNKVSANFSMSSMTDIVFLLLIFFMLTSTLVTTNALDLVLPTSTAKTVKKQTLSVSIDKNNQFYIDRDQVDRDYLESALIEKLSTTEEQAVLILRVEKDVAIQYAVTVMDIAYRNNFKIVLATEPKE